MAKCLLNPCILSIYAVNLTRIINITRIKTPCVQAENIMIQWHRLFGITLTDFFTGTAYKVELEKDLSLKQQLLDVVIIEEQQGPKLEDIPDGLENLGKHNLITYKSHQQSLDAWSLDELTGHYVNYRKMISPSYGKLVDSQDFRLYGISARYPENLSQYSMLNPLSPGVYEIRWGSQTVRIIVLSRVPKDRKNAIWNIFSAVPDTIKFGCSKYQWRTKVSSIINEMLTTYKIEGVVPMTYTIEDYQREYVLQYIDRIPADEILKRFSADDVLKRFSADERLKGISADERLKGISLNEVSNLIKKRFSKAEKAEILKMINEME